MANPNPILKNAAGMIAKLSEHMDVIYILSSVAGWLLSTYAHLKAIKSNDSYSDKQKKFMLTQEKLDAGINIGCFIFLTFAVRGAVGKLVAEGRSFLPKSISQLLAARGLSDQLGKGVQVKDLLSKLGNSVEITNKVDDFNRHTANMKTMAALVSGVVASNIITPFLRNEVAAYRQNRKIGKNKNVPNTTVRPLVINKPATTTNIPNPIYNVAGKVYEKPISNNNGGMRI